MDASLPTSCTERDSGLPVSPVRIVGFDPGLNITGYGVIECLGARVKLVEADVSGREVMVSLNGC